MKLLPICLIAAALITFLSGCATDDSQGGYGAYQQRAQQSGYDPTARLSGSSY